MFLHVLDARKRVPPEVPRETRLSTSAGVPDWKEILAQPRRVQQHAGVSAMARARISSRRLRVHSRRMVASRFFEIDERVDGARGNWPDELPPARSPSRSVHEKCRMDDPWKISLLRDRDAAPNRRDS